jgi:hypothetical protein
LFSIGSRVRAGCLDHLSSSSIPSVAKAVAYGIGVGTQPGIMVRRFVVHSHGTQTMGPCPRL